MAHGQYGHTVHVHSLSQLKVLTACNRPPCPLWELPCVLFPLYSWLGGWEEVEDLQTAAALQALTLFAEWERVPWDVSFTLTNISVVLGIFFRKTPGVWSCPQDKELEKTYWATLRLHKKEIMLYILGWKLKSSYSGQYWYFSIFAVTVGYNFTILKSYSWVPVVLLAETKRKAHFMCYVEHKCICQNDWQPAYITRSKCFFLGSSRPQIIF